MCPLGLHTGVLTSEVIKNDASKLFLKVVGSGRIQNAGKLMVSGLDDEYVGTC